ncbi:hypothetical protein GCM10010525_26320 [Glutamicibacter bergerei]|uniref:Uncharacterized protein n=1 Tax=Glutamicibacter ardleyensis TaxID=225894 RepID=A0ABQ2DE84_9MICC|nr:hypothetical protein GCM10007173_11330 [Glutamicibacter ardleyensis]
MTGDGLSEHHHDAETKLIRTLPVINSRSWLCCPVGKRKKTETTLGRLFFCIF